MSHLTVWFHLFLGMAWRAALFAPRCEPGSIRLNPCILCVLQEMKGQCSSIKIKPILNKHPAGEIVELQPHADAAEVKNHKGFLVCAHSYASCQQKHRCPFALFVRFADELLFKFFNFSGQFYACTGSSPPTCILCYSMSRKKSAAYFLHQSKTRNYIVSVVLYFAGLFIGYSLKLYRRWLIFLNPGCVLGVCCDDELKSRRNAPKKANCVIYRISLKNTWIPVCCNKLQKDSLCWPGEIFVST